MRHSTKQANYIKSLQKKILDNEFVCSGCGKPTKNLEGSHRIPRSMCIGELEHLYSDEENIDLLGGHLSCGCHSKMNTPQMVELNCFEDILEYYRRHSDNMYVKALYEKTKQYIKIRQI